MPWQNVGTLDRSARILAGLVLLALVLVHPSVLSDLFIAVGAWLLATGLSGFCLLYRILHIRTRPKRME